MGRADNNIEAKSRSLTELLDKKKYHVDYFQREYKWERRHIEELLVDLESAFFNNWDAGHSHKEVSNYNSYYLGPIVLYEKDGIQHIIDGQQRLTSLTLMLIYLHHVQKNILEKKDQLEFDSLIIYKKFTEKTFNLEIKNRQAVLNKLFYKHKLEETEITNDSCQNIIERYADIEELFSPKLSHKEILHLFIYWITERLIFTEIKAYTDENAYTIFETMNDRGMRLTSTEMLKSFLLAHVGDEEKITELDVMWKLKMIALKEYSVDEDLDFFKAWLRAKYAESKRERRIDSENEDFEKIGTRFHYWIKENQRFIGLKEQEEFYFFVKSDFQFFVNLYIKLRSYELSTNSPEHLLKLSSQKGVSGSLSYPMLLAPITKVDSVEAIEQKISLVSRYLDSFAVIRSTLEKPVTQSSIRDTLYNQIKEIRNASLEDLERIFIPKNELLLSEIKFKDYIPFDSGYSKNLLARIAKYFNPALAFDDIFFQRKKTSYSLYQFFSPMDVDKEVHTIPSRLKEIFSENLVSYCLIPKNIIPELLTMKLIPRIQYLLKNKFLPEIKHSIEFENISLQSFFIERNKSLKAVIEEIWKI